MLDASCSVTYSGKCSVPRGTVCKNFKTFLRAAQAGNPSGRYAQGQTREATQCGNTKTLTRARSLAPRKSPEALRR
jgi:hypothetical protein